MQRGFASEVVDEWDVTAANALVQVFHVICLVANVVHHRVALGEYVETQQLQIRFVPLLERHSAVPFLEYLRYFPVQIGETKLDKGLVLHVQQRIVHGEKNIVQLNRVANSLHIVC